ncbi:hypothetical protein AAHA92_22342 [Salvia divinorum]|uniref:DUF7138 domain-containing protein n=1 Tax=Salvia divinorum TaxID=28513 RepID=A0ABD1GNE5_SALDI
MVEGGGGPAFPVVFFDGEREMNIGEVRVNPTLEYKPFQHMLSQKIGISPNQISIYLVDRRKNPKSPFSEDRRRIPITGKVNFALICRQKECCFLVVLKRSRKTRNRREKAMTGLDFADLLPGSGFSRPALHSAPENLILLRRNQQFPFHDQILQSEISGRNDRLQGLGAQRENYEMAMARGNFQSSGQSSLPGTGMDLGLHNYDDWYASTTMMMKTDARKVYCEECVNAEKNGKTASFHPCANDAVVTWLPALLGPICRPNNPAL